MSLTEEQRGTAAFDLEKARAMICHYRIENPGDADTDCGLGDLVRQANLAEEFLAEIERLRGFETAARDLNNDLIRIAGERDELAARIQELEDALVEMVATNPCNIPTLCDVVHDELMCLALDGNCDFWKGCPQKNELREAARKQLQAEGKIGPDAKPQVWQITEERKAALWHAINVLKENDIMEEPEEHLWDEEVTVLQAMLTEAGQE